MPSEDVTYFENFDLKSVVTLVDVNSFKKLLDETEYDSKESKWLIDSFSQGFGLGYRGKSIDIQRYAPNLKLRIGNQTILWNKVMKEVKLKRFAGPFETPPFTDFIQSPIGLVPKDGGKSTRLIFHLSYPCEGDSINSCTPKDLCQCVIPGH